MGMMWQGLRCLSRAVRTLSADGPAFRLETFGRRVVLLQKPGSQQTCRLIATSARCHSDDEGVSSKRKRGSRKSSANLSDLPQGLLQKNDDPIAVEETPPKEQLTYPTVIQQARDHMAKFPHCVLLTRVGGFYELYFHQAEHWGLQLNLKVAPRRTGSSTVPMAGFPFFQLERYLKTLVQEFGVHVAIADEVANDASKKVTSGGLKFDRQVRRIITPGTLIDENFLTPNEHNYLLAVKEKPGSQTEAGDPDHSPSNGNDGRYTQLCLAWVDLSSGDFSTQEASEDTLASAISRLSPSELVVDHELQCSRNSKMHTAIADCGRRVTYFQVDNTSDSMVTLETMIESFEEEQVGLNLSQGELACAGMLLNYVQEQLPGLKLRLQPPSKYQAKEHLAIDRNSLRGLEIMQTMKDGSYAGSLLHAIRKTSTRSGARLLSERLKAPSMSLAVIEDRLELVQSLIAHPDIRVQVTALLTRTTDSLRLVQSLACGKGDAQDLINLARTVHLSRRIAETITSLLEGYPSLRALNDRLQWDGPDKLAARISEAIDEEGLLARHRNYENDAAEAASMASEAIAAEGEADMAALHKRLASLRTPKSAKSGSEENEEDSEDVDEIWIMRRNASNPLAALHDILLELKKEKKRLAANLQEQLSAKSLLLKFTPSLGHIVYVKGKDTKSDPSKILPNARTVSSTKSTRSFYLPDWTSLGTRLESAKLRIRAEEQQIFKSLREEVCKKIVPLRNNAKILDELDVGCSSAILAEEQDLVRPILDDSTSMHIVDGRHMTVESGLKTQGRGFMPNDCLLGSSGASQASSPLPDGNVRPGPGDYEPLKPIHLITGPNMAGKSTYLRQNALISILAQTGVYVPASYARLGLVDAVFSRIGSADNLYQDQSTFMVEMLETAEILRNAGKRSLVVMDEVGRGTSPEDGVAVGYAVLDTLRREGVGRVMFATHFHRIIDLCGGWDEVECYCTRIHEYPPSDGREEAGKLSFRFDHKMRRGVNRDSHALKVARLAGIPDGTLNIAHDILTDLKREKEG